MESSVFATRWVARPSTISRTLLSRMVCRSLLLARKPERLSFARSRFLTEASCSCLYTGSSSAKQNSFFVRSTPESSAFPRALMQLRSLAGLVRIRTRALSLLHWLMASGSASSGMHSRDSSSSVYLPASYCSIAALRMSRCTVFSMNHSSNTSCRPLASSTSFSSSVISQADVSIAASPTSTGMAAGGGGEVDERAGSTRSIGFQRFSLASSLVDTLRLEGLRIFGRLRIRGSPVFRSMDELDDALTPGVEPASGPMGSWPMTRKNPRS
mmetsp:Transcript_7056/g.20413  ORF Transcript_7056/g.20413 Transcript_7056/m.20413 type:complete len:270 (+) Transcript_7056:576-1385(+)